MHDELLGELDEQLKDLIILAQQYLPSSKMRQKVLNRLIKMILDSGQLWCSSKGGLNSDAYDEALQNLFLYIYKHIDKYKPERGSVMTWINILLHQRFFKEAYAKVKNDHIKNSLTISTFDDYWENFVVLNQEKLSLTEKLRNFIEADPDNFLKKEYVCNQAKANFQFLLMQRLSGESWQEISLHLKIKTTTLSSFYERCIDKLAPVQA